MRRALASDEVREMIEFRMKALRDEATRMERARQESWEQGRQQGIELGKMEVVRRMLAFGMSPEAVSQISGLSLELLVSESGSPPRSP